MNHIPFAEFLERFPCILGEGAIIERLRRNGGLDLDPYLVNSDSFMKSRNVRPWKPSVGSTWT